MANMFTSNTKLDWVWADSTLEGRAVVDKRGFNKLEKGSDWNLRKSSKDKCKVLHLWFNNPRQMCTLDTRSIENSFAEMDLVSKVHTKLIMSQHSEMKKCTLACINKDIDKVQGSDYSPSCTCHTTHSVMWVVLLPSTRHWDTGVSPVSHQEDRGQQIMEGDCPPLLYPCEASLGILHPGLGSRAQESLNHRMAWVGRNHLVPTPHHRQVCHPPDQMWMC